jgi:hypothetical protein
VNTFFKFYTKFLLLVRSQAKLKLILLVLVVLFGIAQNCTRVRFNEKEDSVTELSLGIIEQLSASSIRQCSTTNQVVLKIAKRKLNNLLCKDISTLLPDAELGNSCGATATDLDNGVIVTPIDPSPAEVPCKDVTLCGVLPVSKIFNDEGDLQVTFDNLPWGCNGNIELRYKNSTKVLSIFEVIIPVPECRTCIQTGVKTCGVDTCSDSTCPNPEPGVSELIYRVTDPYITSCPAGQIGHGELQICQASGEWKSQPDSSTCTDVVKTITCAANPELGISNTAEYPDETALVSCGVGRTDFKQYSCDGATNQWHATSECPTSAVNNSQCEANTNFGINYPIAVGNSVDIYCPYGKDPVDVDHPFTTYTCAADGSNQNALAPSTAPNCIDRTSSICTAGATQSFGCDGSQNGIPIQGRQQYKCEENNWVIDNSEGAPKCEQIGCAKDLTNFITSIGLEDQLFFSNCPTGQIGQKIYKCTRKVTVPDDGSAAFTWVEDLTVENSNTCRSEPSEQSCLSYIQNNTLTKDHQNLFYCTNGPEAIGGLDVCPTNAICSGGVKTDCLTSQTPDRSTEPNQCKLNLPRSNYGANSHSFVTSTTVSIDRVSEDGDGGEASYIWYNGVSDCLGLSVDPSSGQITGTTSAIPQENVTCNVSATNSSGNIIIPLVITLTQGPQLPVVSYNNGSAIQVTVGVAITPISPEIQPGSGGTYVYSVSGGIDDFNLQTGLYFSATTGVISGTPISGIQQSARYTVTATNTTNGGSPSGEVGSFVLERSEAIENPIISYGNNNLLTTVGQSILSPYYTVTNTGGEYSSCTASPDLPTGLSMDNHCTISGAPALEADVGPHSITITATNPQASKSGSVDIMINVDPRVSRPELFYEHKFATAGEQITLSPQTPAGGSSPADSYAFDATTPCSNFQIDSLGVITSDSNQAAPIGSYSCWVVAHNSAGDTRAEALITISATPQPPSLTYPSVSFQSNSEMAYAIAPDISNDGDDVVYFLPQPNSFATDFPNLYFEESTGKISGRMPTVNISATHTYTVGSVSAISGRGSNNVGTFTITVYPQPLKPIVSYPNSNSVTITEGQSYNDVTAIHATNASGAGNIQSCYPRIDDNNPLHRLPAGLTIDSSTCNISGVPSGAGTYTVTVIAGNNTAGNQDPITLNVVVIPFSVIQPNNVAVGIVTITGVEVTAEGTGSDSGLANGVGVLVGTVTVVGIDVLAPGDIAVGTVTVTGVNVSPEPTVAVGTVTVTGANVLPEPTVTVGTVTVTGVNVLPEPTVTVGTVTVAGVNVAPEPTVAVGAVTVTGVNVLAEPTVAVGSVTVTGVNVLAVNVSVGVVTVSSLAATR